MEMPSDDENKGYKESNADSSDKLSERLDGKTVLAVDDDRMMLRVVQKSVQSISRNCKVETANSGKSAIKKIEEGLKPDLIISDMRMPDGTGEDLYNWLMQNRQELIARIIFVTGETADSSSVFKEICQNMNAQGRLIKKPFYPAELRKCIASVLSLSSKNKTQSGSEKNTEDKPKAIQENILRRIVHDLNNIISVISANVSGLRDSLAEGERLSADERGMIDDLADSPRLLTEIVAQLKSEISEGNITVRPDIADNVINITFVISANASGLCDSLMRGETLSATERDMIDDIVKISKRLIEIGV